MIPELADSDGPWNMLPHGIHEATLDEIEQRFATNDTRQRLYQGFREGVEALRKAGCRVVYLDGSFVSEREYPGDFDACWDPTHVDLTKLDPILIDRTDLRTGRKGQKEKYSGEFFPSSVRADSSLTFLEYFQIDKDTKNAKGIIRIRIT